MTEKTIICHMNDADPVSAAVTVTACFFILT